MGLILLIVAAVIIRIVGAAARSLGTNPPRTLSRLAYRACGWLFCSIAAWLTSCAAGAWFPPWPVIGLALIGTSISVVAHRRKLWLVGDILVVTLVTSLSIPPLGWASVIAATIALAGFGLVVDAIADSVSIRARNVVLVATLVAFVSGGTALGVVRLGHWAERIRLLTTLLPRLGVAPMSTGERVVLKTGAVAWLEMPHAEGPFTGALLFHGARPEGSNQPAAYVLRRALLQAGFVVLAVDHPGFGHSPATGSKAGLTSWDPLPTSVAALESLQSVKSVSQVLLLGHSMGTVDVLRLLGIKPQVLGAVLFGSSFSDGPERDQYWYKRFHDDRRMTEKVSFERFVEIRDAYYNPLRYIETLDEDHAPILYVRFGIEHSNIVATRDKLYAALPGAKRLWDFAESNHHFSSREVRGLLVGNTHITHLLASRLRRFAKCTQRPIVSRKDTLRRYTSFSCLRSDVE